MPPPPPPPVNGGDAPVPKAALKRKAAGESVSSSLPKIEEVSDDEKSTADKGGNVGDKHWKGSVAQFQPKPRGAGLGNDVCLPGENACPPHSSATGGNAATLGGRVPETVDRPEVIEYDTRVTTGEQHEVAGVLAIHDPDGSIRYICNRFMPFTGTRSFREAGWNSPEEPLPRGKVLYSEDGQWEHYRYQPRDLSGRPVGPVRFWWSHTLSGAWFYEPRPSILIASCSEVPQTKRRITSKGPML